MHVLCMCGHVYICKCVRQWCPFLGHLSAADEARYWPIASCAMGVWACSIAERDGSLVCGISHTQFTERKISHWLVQTVIYPARYLQPVL